MTIEQQRRSADLFEAVVDLPPAEREAALRSRETIEPEVVAEVRALLGVSEDQIAPLFAMPASEPEIPAPGSEMGPYRIEDELGRGGYGVVFRATRRIAGAEAAVAIKFLQVSLDNEKARQRFDLERQTLAGLDHPGIARLLDGGTTSGGVPYLAAELIDGQPIDEYCDSERLTIPRRLELFRHVCEAVEHAHGRQLLHRDIKPDNLFVTRDGTAKLLDFGIAKVLGSKRYDLPPTLPMQRLFTLAYASPEQIEGKTLSYSTDVYSLGVVLYELVSGHRPYGSQANLAEAWATRQRVPTAPSAAVLLEEENRTPGQISAARDSRPGQLRRALRGDLDAVILNALQPDQRERYPSVGALRFDIERFLAGMPVEAAKPGAFARAAKWARRNLATAALLAVSIAVAGWGMYGSGRDQLRLTLARNERNRLAAKTGAVLMGFRNFLFITGEGNPAAEQALRDTYHTLLVRSERSLLVLIEPNRKAQDANRL